jgi:hypothetical protein
MDDNVLVNLLEEQERSLAKEPNPGSQELIKQVKRR